METGLLKQTKKDLVRIILRKDAVEKELRSEIEYLKALCMAQDALELNIDEFIAKNTEKEDEKED